MQEEKDISPNSPQFKRSGCGVANTLDIVGDKWTLVVIRDLMLGPRRYGDFLKSPENIRTNILAERLKRLEQTGIVEKRAYQSNPTRYEYLLTAKGKDLLPILHEMQRWANKYVPGASEMYHAYVHEKSPLRLEP